MPAYQFGGQPIEQLRMTRGTSLRAEIVFRLHDASSEILLPEAVDGDSRQKRIVGGYDPLRQIEAIRLASRTGLRHRMKNGGNSGRDFAAVACEIALHEKETATRLRLFHHDESCQGGCTLLKFGQFARPSFEFRVIGLESGIDTP